MFPIAHAWLLEQLVPAATPAHYLGCIWPDMLYGSPLSHEQSHRSGVQLVALAVAQAPLPAGSATPSTGQQDELGAFVAGVLTHGTAPHGFDWYSDEQYGDRLPEERGYAFQRGLPLAHDAASACGVPAAQGWWKAHNIIEMSFERPLYTAEPALGERLAAACADEALIRHVAAMLAPCFAVDVAALGEAMRRFPMVVNLRPHSVAGLASTYAQQTRLRHPGAKPDEAAIARLIERAAAVTAVDSQRFLDSCVARVGAMLRATPPS
jgi:hypothetical protein